MRGFIASQGEVVAEGAKLALLLADPNTARTHTPRAPIDGGRSTTPQAAAPRR
jgi:hypothetical protein